jgi:TonB family protein
MDTKILPRRLAVVAALLLTSLPALAAGGPATWNQRVQESEALLRAGDYAQALAVTGPLLDEVGSGIAQAGEKAESALGTVYSLHALALAGAGRQEDAEWHWYLAQSLKPDLAETSLAGYGVAGERLEPHRFAEGDEPCRLPERELAELPSPEPPEVKPPERRKGNPSPQYTPAARAMGIEGEVMIRAVLNAEGRLEAPCVLDADHPIFVYMVGRAMREWEFRPAKRGGEPVAIQYNMTTSFTLDHRHPH